MGNFSGPVRVGLRDKETNKLVAVYPEEVEGNLKEVENKVKFWYYQQSCSAEDELSKYFIDVLNENELKSMRK